jgi:hypothetical protein
LRHCARPVTALQGQASLNNKLNQAHMNIDNATDNLLSVQSAVGSRLKELDYLDSSGDDLNLQYAATLSDLQDVDTVKAISCSPSSRPCSMRRRSRSNPCPACRCSITSASVPRKSPARVSVRGFLLGASRAALCPGAGLLGGQYALQDGVTLLPLLHAGTAQCLVAGIVLAQLIAQRRYLRRQRAAASAWPLTAVARCWPDRAACWLSRPPDCWHTG